MKKDTSIMGQIADDVKSLTRKMLKLWHLQERQCGFAEYHQQELYDALCNYSQKEEEK